MRLSAESDSVRLQQRDVLLLRGLFESRVLSLAHATTLYFESKAEPAKKRVQKLKAGGVIGERPRRLYEKSILFLTSPGYRLLMAGGHLDGYPRLTAAEFEQRSRVSELTLRHELEIQDVKVAFASSLRGNGPELKDFWTWPRLSQFVASSGDSQFVPMKPDGFLRIHEKEKDGTLFESTFFLEIDRSSENREQLAARARCYLNYYQHGGFAEWNGHPRAEFQDFPFRVLMVFKTAERRNTMAVHLLGGRPQILTHSWLTTFAEAKSDPLGKIWVRPKDYLAIEQEYISLRSAWDGRVFRREASREQAIEIKVSKHRLLGPDNI